MYTTVGGQNGKQDTLRNQHGVMFRLIFAIPGAQDSEMLRHRLAAFVLARLHRVGELFRSLPLALHYLLPLGPLYSCWL